MMDLKEFERKFSQAKSLISSRISRDNGTMTNENNAMFSPKMVSKQTVLP